MKLKGFRSSAALVVLALSACSGGHDMGPHGMAHDNLPPAAALLNHALTPGLPQPTQLEDLDPAPGVVEVALVAAPGKKALLTGKPADLWLYNGQLPGPTLRAKVGDKVVVKFHNQLPEATSIHWHGMRVPHDMDGMVEVPAGGNYTYEFTLLDAGTFWYHPHVHTAVQVERGLYGAIVVEDLQAPDLATVADETLVLDDALVDAQTGQLDETWDARMEMMGREGNLLLISGEKATRELQVRAGERRLWRLVNAANSRYFQLELQGGAMVRVGGDRGWLTKPELATSLLLVPGQRAMVVVAAGDGPAVLRAVPYERAMGAGHTAALDLVRLVPDGQPAATPPALPAAFATITGPAQPTATRKLVLDERMKPGAMLGMDHGDEGMMEFTINGKVFPHVPALLAKAGTVQRWEIDNTSAMDHPFHVHGFFFQRLGSNEWQDSINVPGESKLSLLVNFDDRPGAKATWVYHCHILEHADRGMVGTVVVD